VFLWIALFIPGFLSANLAHRAIGIATINVFHSDVNYIRIFVLQSMTIAIILLFSRLMFAASNMCRIASDRCAAMSASRLRRIDSRPPVLYLRSFRNDRLRTRDPRELGIARLFDPYRDRLTMEQLISRRSFVLGPIVAIADPKSKMQAIGAARAFVRGGDWKEVVQSLMHEAKLIVVLMDMTENLTWEIAQVTTPDLLSKTLFVFPPALPKAASTEPPAIELLRPVLSPDAFRKLGHPELASSIRAIRFAPFRATVVASQTATISDYELAFDVLSRDADSYP
jgi:hypothetical protein